jgi:threonylcarbamoyladenosine tRNA methylthiotransferase MtaB
VDILNEVKALEDGGYLEVVLTGTHIGLYGRDLNHKASLYVLINNLLKNTSKIRIRLSSLEAQEVTDEIIGLLKHERLCSHLHIPLQSGDDRVLSLMKRPYRVKDYIRTIEKLLTVEPDICIGTDIIVGFPGEGEREFENTMKLVEEIPFSYLHIFPFSPRPGTMASDMPGQVSREEKKARALRLREMDQKKRKLYRERFINTVLSCVYEQQGPDGFCVYRSDNYIKLYSSNFNHSRKTSFLRLKGVRLYKDGLLGEPIIDV